MLKEKKVSESSKKKHYCSVVFDPVLLNKVGFQPACKYGFINFVFQSPNECAGLMREI